MRGAIASPSLPPRPAPIVLPQGAASCFKGGWRAEYIKRNSIELIVVELDETYRLAIKKRQAIQRR